MNSHPDITRDYAQGHEQPWQHIKLRDDPPRLPRVLRWILKGAVLVALAWWVYCLCNPPHTRRHSSECSHGARHHHRNADHSQSSFAAAPAFPANAIMRSIRGDFRMYRAGMSNSCHL